MILAAALLIYYSFTIEQRRMIGDEAGHDPGSRALPLGSGVVMLIAGLYDLGKQVQRRRGQELQRVDAKGAEGILFWGTLSGSILYLFLLEQAGFLILTTLFLYLLFFFYKNEAAKSEEESNRREAVKRNEEGSPPEVEKETPTPLSPMRSSFKIGDMLAGGVLSCILVSLCYVAGRIVSRELFYWGRSMGSPVLASRMVSLLVFFLISGGIYGGALLVSRKTPFWKFHSVRGSVFLSVGTVLALFIVFRMIFRVALPPGILDL